MFGSIDKSKGYLFCTYDLQQTLQNMQRKMREEIEGLDGNRLLNTAIDDLTNYFVEKYRMEPLVLLRANWFAETQEIEIDVRNDPLRFISDHSKPALVAGERTTIRVPFEGESELFYSRSNVSSQLPRGTVDRNELVLHYDMPSDAPRDVRPLVDQELAGIEQYMAWQRPIIDSHNTALSNLARQAIDNRRKRILAQTQRADALGIPVKRRDGTAQTYTVPTVRRKVAPTLPPATSAQFEPEPTWAMEHYEEALKVIQDMSLVIERSPSSFKTMDEEAIRHSFLIPLNAQFGGKATGETFNMEGKTDILLREGNRMYSSPNASSGRVRRPSGKPLTSSSAMRHGGMARRRSSYSIAASTPAPC